MDSPKKLRRSVTDRRIAGVCGGIAEYLCVDVMLVRLLFVLGLLLVGGTLWAYLIMWIVIPE